MRKEPGIQMDERNVSQAHKICARLYLLTIALLWLDVFWRQFVLGQPLARFWDLAALMTANVLLLIAALLYYGGVTVPKMRASTTAVLYGVCVAVGTLVTAYRYQLRTASEILGKLVVVAAVAGLIVILYAVAAYLGARRTEREISE